jgi:hypothetical protein
MKRFSPGLGSQTPEGADWMRHRGTRSTFPTAPKPHGGKAQHFYRKTFRTRHKASQNQQLDWKTVPTPISNMADMALHSPQIR